MLPQTLNRFALLLDQKMADFRDRNGGAGEGNRTLVVSLGRLGRVPKTKENRQMSCSESSEQPANETGFSPTITAGLPHTSPTPPEPAGSTAGPWLADKVLRGEIKALSIKQPYPHHIFHDGKDVENRDWPTRGRGWFIIHAGISRTELASSQMHLPRGGIVGMARIVDCVTAMDSEWFFGRYGFVLREAFPVELIPCRGALGFFMPPVEVLEQLAAAITRTHGATS